jgi:PQQ-dependent catabolism-associated CXXCW motif protein
MICHPPAFAKALVPEWTSHYSRRMTFRCIDWLLAGALHMRPRAAHILASVLVVLANGVLAQQPVGADSYAEEDRDWGIAATNRLRQQPYHGPTPLTIPGAQVVRTRELQAMLAGAGAPILIDVLSEGGHVTLAGAVWISGAGRGTNFMDPVQSTLTQLLEKLGRGDKARAMVFFCASSQCWLSYNAALRAVAAGYSRVYWYRGGIESWGAAGLPTAKTSGQAAAP